MESKSSRLGRLAKRENSRLAVMRKRSRVALRSIALGGKSALRAAVVILRSSRRAAPQNRQPARHKVRRETPQAIRQGRESQPAAVGESRPLLQPMLTSQWQPTIALLKQSQRLHLNQEPRVALDSQSHIPGWDQPRSRPQPPRPTALSRRRSSPAHARPRTARIAVRPLLLQAEVESSQALQVDRWSMITGTFSDGASVTPRRVGFAT